MLFLLLTLMYGHHCRIDLMWIHQIEKSLDISTMVNSTVNILSSCLNPILEMCQSCAHISDDILFQVPKPLWYGIYCEGLQFNLFNFHIMYTGENSATKNLHLLRHVVSCVHNRGPLWAYSCFSFEGMNGQLKSFFHGSRNMNKQVNTCFCMDMLNYETISYHAALFSAGIQLHNVTDVAFTSENTQTTTTQGPVDI